MEFIVYDDCGVIHRGSKEECQKAIRDWSRTEEAEEIYNEDDLGNIYRFFNKNHQEDYFEYYGFKIEKIDR
ncbi:MAG: hypothetical protein QM490_03980 [Candidatus Gracilibacteria bacterium]